MYQVIIVEDDPMVASINRQYVETVPQLKIRGIFKNGRDALDYLTAHPVDLAIIDYYMPVMDGLHLIREIRERNMKVDIIMVTAANDASNIEEMVHLGVVDYLVKPFEFNRFRVAINRFLHKKSTLISRETLSQSEIDRLLAADTAPSHSSPLIEKGLQEKTLNLILDFLKNNRTSFYTSEEIAKQVHLSRVTVRRYMNYLVESSQIISQIDYSTGGRPSITYQMRK